MNFKIFMTLLQLFYRFLKINNIYHLFFYNMQNIYCESFYQYKIENIKTYKAYYLIHNAFRWTNTKEGFEFWLKFNIKWGDIILYIISKSLKNETLISLKSNKEIKVNDELIKMLKI